MKFSIRAGFFLFMMIIILNSCKTGNKTTGSIVKLKTFNDTISYILGSDVAANLKKSSVEINTDVFIKAFIKNLSETDTTFSKEARQKIMAGFQKELQVKQQTRMIEESKKNKLAGEAFLRDNKTREGIIELPGGLQYKIITLGTGKKPGPDDEVTVNYEGRLIDGTIFDSSYERKSSSTFPIEGVIKGWNEGLQLMNTGSVYEFYIPSDLAYGDKGFAKVPGGSVLIFKIELVSVKDKQ